MSVLYGKFELPEAIKVDEGSATANFCRFIAEPLERGFGHTIGNSLRRVMLSALEAPAIVSIMIEGVPHEYSAIEGVIEDMTNIVLNLKGALLRKLPKQEEQSGRGPRLVVAQLEIGQDQLDRNGGRYQVTLRDLIQSSDFEVINPDHPIFTVTAPFMRRVQLRIAVGRGYVPSERHELGDRVVDEIIIDSLFSPVRLVNYYVEHTRVGQDTDFDRLILEVTTDGRVSPREALSFSSQIAVRQFATFEKVGDEALVFEKGEAKGSSDREEMLSRLALRVGEIELSVRSTNCLKTAGIHTIGELVVMAESEMLRFRNFGKKSLAEIRQKLEDMGLGFGMDLSAYGIFRDNVADIVNAYLEERASRETLDALTSQGEDYEA